MHFVALHYTIATGYLPGYAVRAVNEVGSVKRSTIDDLDMLSVME